MASTISVPFGTSRVNLPTDGRTEAGEGSRVKERDLEDVKVEASVGSDESSSGTPLGSPQRQISQFSGSGGLSVGREGEGMQNEEEDPAFEVENIICLGTFVIGEHEKIILTMEAGVFAKLVDMFRRDPYIHVTQTSRFNNGSLEALWATIQLPPEYSLRVPTTNERIFFHPNRYWVKLPAIHFRFGLRFPLHSFIRDLLRDFFHYALR